MSADNTICDGHQHICKEGLFLPVAVIYSKTLMTDLHGKTCLPDAVPTSVKCFGKRWAT
ncbi:hypothetical protein HMPREF9303_0457 [Prevotella denticola CRIS 18C-A]|uniref:Uncharacterized protein n=1 Tax=Prevotella denticola CRIS 18C-A TaxID=944557 RepID=F0H736_9BACT|nr:hypothetical protein HMPREF9303_0457 [Prevotella denticola CRIS 18C-A]